jgi:hypothetical protein
MVEEYLKYIDKQDCERRGLVWTADGKPYKQSTLERYEAKGYLDGEKYDSIQLMGAGKKLWEDFCLAHICGVKANDLSRVRVDGGGGYTDSETKTFAEDRYQKACKSLPREFKDIVTNVCCWDIDIIGEITEDSKRQKQYRTQVLLALLRLGLVRLVEHYR